MVFCPDGEPAARHKGYPPLGGPEKLSVPPKTAWLIRHDQLREPRVQPDPVIAAIDRYRCARVEVDKIAVREPMLPNGHSADETEEYATWETANLKATDAAATAWTEVATTQPTTVAGAIALIDCYLEIWSERPSKLAYPEASWALRGLRAFLRKLAAFAHVSAKEI